MQELVLEKNKANKQPVLILIDIVIYLNGKCHIL